MNRSLKFLSMLDAVKESNPSLIEGIRSGFVAIMEAKQTKDFKELKNFGIGLLFVAQEFHIWHLNCDDLNEHELLKSVYETLEDIADKISETIISIEDKDITSKLVNFQVKNYKYNKKEVIKRLEAIKIKLQGFNDSMFKQDGLKNIFADGLEHIDNFLYKFKRF